ncbi:hypothetical protein [Streptomyces europaeiscabiei]|uniref:hypothetical protein n=1 Tax=Streptomyces europaeiscabiei TaxID=146819 RepID=UPI0029AC1837|nr:hypothetical protein [Streptomyces europaeiscabiei]MDX2763303.1 hypothetical protein [Streptomyces europaeiscabiei]
MIAFEAPNSGNRPSSALGKIWEVWTDMRISLPPQQSVDGRPPLPRLPASGFRLPASGFRLPASGMK